MDLLNKVGPQFVTPVMAYKWYRSEPLAGFDAKLRCNSYRQAKHSKSSSTLKLWGRESFIDIEQSDASAFTKCLLPPFMDADASGS